MRFAVLALTVATVLCGISASHAEFVVNFTQDGNDVVASGSGTLDLSGLTFAGSSYAGTGIIPSEGVLGLGPTTGANYYTGVSGPSGFGTGGATVSSTTSGDFVGVEEGPGYLVVPIGFLSGGALSGTDTFANATFASLGLTPGRYTYDWNVPDDSLVINIPSGVPELSTWAMMLLGFSGLGYLAYRRSTNGALLPLTAVA